MATKQNYTHWKKFFDYKYLGSYSLADSDDEDTAKYPPVNVTIAKFATEMVRNERGTDECLIFWFKEDIKGENKPMIVNKTNCKIIEDITKDFRVEKWMGLQLQLYVDTNVKTKGRDVTSGLRFREIPPKPQLTPKHPKWADAKLGVKAGTTIELIRKHYDITDKNFELLSKGDE